MPQLSASPPHKTTLTPSVVRVSKIRYADFESITRTKSFPEGTNEPMEVLEIIMELWERCDKDREIRAIGVSLGEFKKTKVRQIALGEDYDMEKTSFHYA